MTNRLLKEAKQTTPNLGYIVGVLLGDGYFDRGKYGVLLETIDEKFALRFAKSLKEWSGFHVSWREFIRRYRNRSPKARCKKKYDSQMFKTAIWSKEAYYFLKKILTDWFSWVKNADRETKLAVIKGFYDSDGSFSRIIRKRRGRSSYVKTHLSMGNMNHTLLKFIGTLVEDCLGIKLSLRIYPYECFLGTQDKEKAQVFLKGIGEKIKKGEI